MNLRLITLLIIGFSSSINADVLSPAYAYVWNNVEQSYGSSISNSLDNTTNPENISLNLNSLDSTASTSNVNGGTLSATANITNYYGVWSQATLTYYFMVNGPANQTVTAHIDGSTSANIGGTDFAFARSIIDISADSGYIAGYSNQICLGGCGSSSIPNSDTYQYITAGTSYTSLINQDFNVTTGIVYNVYLDSDVYGYSGGVASASVDPIISLNVSGNNASQYSLSMSSNISAVPVPSAIWLFGSALAGFGMLRNRKAS